MKTQRDSRDASCAAANFTPAREDDKLRDNGVLL